MTSHVLTHKTVDAGWLRALRAFGSDLVTASTGAHCARQANRLYALSDADLAAMGLTRDRIVQHAFRRFLMS